MKNSPYVQQDLPIGQKPWPSSRHFDPQRSGRTTSHSTSAITATSQMPSSTISPEMSDVMIRDFLGKLFIGSTPPGTSEALLMQFLNGAMRRVNLCAPDATPILACRLNQKSAFVECTSVEDANNCMNLTGIPFLGASLKVSRPSKYAGPMVPHQTWQQLTGQPLIAGMTGDVSADEKLSRELFVGNTSGDE